LHRGQGLPCGKDSCIEVAAEEPKTQSRVFSSENPGAISFFNPNNSLITSEENEVGCP
jgi:hypothetical protein